MFPGIVPNAFCCSRQLFFPHVLVFPGHVVLGFFDIRRNFCSGIFFLPDISEIPIYPNSIYPEFAFSLLFDEVLAS